MVTSAEAVKSARYLDRIWPSPSTPRRAPTAQMTLMNWTAALALGFEPAFSAYRQNPRFIATNMGVLRVVEAIPSGHPAALSNGCTNAGHAERVCPRRRN